MLAHFIEKERSETRNQRLIQRGGSRHDRSLLPVSFTLSSRCWRVTVVAAGYPERTAVHYDIIDALSET